MFVKTGFLPYPWNTFFYDRKLSWVFMCQFNDGGIQYPMTFAFCQRWPYYTSMALMLVCLISMVGQSCQIHIRIICMLLYASTTIKISLNPGFLGVLRKCSKENTNKLHLPHRLHWFIYIYTYFQGHERIAGRNMIKQNLVACEGVMLGTVSTFYDVDAVLIAVSAWCELYCWWRWCWW